MASLQPYHYHDLPPRSTRVLCLVEIAGDAGAWSLRTIQLLDQGAESSSPHYDALSYTWGSLDKTYPLNCDGQALKNHPNFHIALP